MTAIEKVKIAVNALDSKKAVDIKVIEIAEVSNIADYFVIATGTSGTHVRTLADETEYQMSEKGEKVDHIEGRGTQWLLLDYIDVVVHVFSGENRSYYDLERLWMDGKELDYTEFLNNEENK